VKGFIIKRGMGTEGEKEIEEKRCVARTSGYSESLRRGLLKDRHTGFWIFFLFRLTKAANC